MNKFLFQTPNLDIYTFNGTTWTVLGNGEPTDSMFIKSGVTSVSITNFQALVTLTGADNIDVLASKQADSISVENNISADMPLDSGSCKTLDIDLSIYAKVNSINIVEI